MYSLLVLTTHPPVPQKIFRTWTASSKFFFNNFRASHTKTQIGLVSKDTSPFIFLSRFRSASLPKNFWWSWRRELNPRPSDYKSDALPAELRQRRSNRVILPEAESELQGPPAASGKFIASFVENWVDCAVLKNPYLLYYLYVTETHIPR